MSSADSRPRHRCCRLLDRLLSAIGDAGPADPRAASAASSGLKGGYYLGLRFPRFAAVGQALHVDRQSVGHHTNRNPRKPPSCRPSGATYGPRASGPMPSSDRIRVTRLRRAPYAATTRLACGSCGRLRGSDVADSRDHIFRMHYNSRRPRKSPGRRGPLRLELTSMRHRCGPIASDSSAMPIQSRRCCDRCMECRRHG